MGRNKNERRGFYGKSIAQKQRNKNEKRNKSDCNKNEWGQYSIYLKLNLPMSFVSFNSYKILVFLNRHKYAHPSVRKGPFQMSLKEIYDKKNFKITPEK